MSGRDDSYLAGLIGDGVTVSLTPVLHEREADAQGLRCVYRPVDVACLPLPAERMGELLRPAAMLGFNAFNVTFPCKQSVIPFLDELDPVAAQLGAVNVVRVHEDLRLTGHNTDHSGFAWGMRHALGSAPRDVVVQLGSGGAGSAVAFALLSQGVARLHLVDLDRARAQERAEHLGRQFPAACVSAHAPSELAHLLDDAQGLVNCTPVGMHHHPGIPLPPELITSALWVSDIVYRPLRTELLAAAEAAGCLTMDGGWMATGQAIEGFRIMTGREPDPVRMRELFMDLVREAD